ncbi:hypothetical protein C0989_005477, partial [Termitomyces sp. Mn162]
EQLELGKLLGTKEGLEAMAKFLQKTGALTKTGTKCRKKEKPTKEDDGNDQEEERWWQRMEGRREGADDLTEGVREEEMRGGGAEGDGER